MTVQVQALSLPKAGNEEAENEDAFWPEVNGESRALPWRGAVADGATETTFSRLWARMLVRAFGRRRLDDATLAAELPPVQQRWLRLVTRRPLPWYAEQKIEAGAHAAFLGLEIFGMPESCPAGAGTWRAWALGDACVVQVTAGGWELAAAFPLVCSDEFGSRPHLLSSRTPHNEQTLTRVTRHEGTWRVGDVFYLLTDALAAWFLRETEQKRHPCKILDAHLGSATDFAQWTDEQRRSGALRNDDVTIVRIETR